MDKTKRNVALLATCQALLFTNNTSVIAVNGLAGYALAADKGFATLPITAWVVGGASVSFLASMLMRRYGRRVGFTIGALFGLVGTSIAAFAILMQSFLLLCVGTFIFGAFNGFGTYFRFAAADAAPIDQKARAISLVLAGGLVGGLAGPQLSSLALGAVSTKFLGVYLAAAGVILAVIVVVQFLDIPKPTEAELAGEQRPLLEIMREPKFIVALCGAALSYAVMNLLMTATPLEMTAVCGHSYSAAVWVVGIHVIGMFGPSLVTGTLIKRFGVLNVMFVGVLLNFVCIGIALSGTSVAHFMIANFILGVGWNFLYTGGSVLLTQVYRPAERAKTQGINDSLVFVVMVVTSFMAGFMLNANGWAMLNYVAIVVMTFTGAVILWLMLRRAPAAAPA